MANLGLSLSANSVTEGSAPVTATLTLNPAPTASTVVNLTSSDTNSATVPSSITVSAGQGSVTFPVTVVDDTLLDGTRNVTITAAASGYTGATTNLMVNDNETAVLSVTAASPVSEAAGTVQGTLHISAPPAVAITVTLSSSNAASQVPSTVTIPAGQTAVSFPITIIDDHLVNGDQTAIITAHVTNWTDGTRPW